MLVGLSILKHLCRIALSNTAVDCVCRPGVQYYCAIQHPHFPTESKGHHTGKPSPNSSETSPLCSWLFSRLCLRPIWFERAAWQWRNAYDRWLAVFLLPSFCFSPRKCSKPDQFRHKSIHQSSSIAHILNYLIRNLLPFYFVWSFLAKGLNVTTTKLC